jgi:hyperosmotically inducible protein
MKKTLLATLLACAFAAPAYAQSNDRFRLLDRNGDGALTLDEVSHLKGFDRAFGEADDNKDGRLDEAEFMKADSLHDRQRIGEYVDDGTLTAKVKTALLRERGLKSRDVHVESDRGRVLLSGFVDSEDQKKRAVAVAQRVDGVTEVRDGLSVR